MHSIFTSQSSLSRNIANVLSLMASLAALYLACPTPVLADEDNLMKQIWSLNWHHASQTVPIAGVANIKLPAHTMALGRIDSNKFIQLTGNPPNEDAYVVSSDDFRWFAIFSFDPSGYVRDDETIDPDSLLEKLRANNEQGIAKRIKLGLTPLHLIGWFIPPHYDLQSKRLEWGTKLYAGNDRSELTVNYTTRLLGRTGVMSAMLVSEPDNMDQDVKLFHELLNHFEYVDGQRYAEFRVGDKVAQYGLTALIVGGGAAVAAKAGGGLIKAGAAAVLALLAGLWAGIKSLLRRGSRSQIA